MPVCVSDIKEQLLYCKTGKILSFSNHILPHGGRIMHCTWIYIVLAPFLRNLWAETKYIYTNLIYTIFILSSRSGTTLQLIWKSFWPPHNFKFFTLFCLYRLLWEIRAELGYNFIWVCLSMWFHSHRMLYTHSILFFHCFIIVALCTLSTPSLF